MRRCIVKVAEMNQKATGEPQILSRKEVISKMMTAKGCSEVATSGHDLVYR